MKRFLLYVLLFSLLVTGSLAVGEIIVRHSPNPYAIKDAYIHQHGDSITTLVLGSSHTFYGIVADSLGSQTLNLANVSQNYEYDFRLLSRYSPLMPNLRRVIIPVSYFSFFDPPFESGDEKWTEIYYRLYMGIDKYPRLSPYGFEVSNLTVFAGKLQSILMGKQRQLSSPQGFGLIFTLADRSPDWKLTGPAHAAKHTASDGRYTAYNVAWLDSLLQFCTTRHIRPLLITTPFWSGYREHLNRVQQRVSQRLTDSLIQVYDLHYMDFSANPLFTEDDFYDADHLSDSGAMRLTRILRDSLMTK